METFTHILFALALGCLAFALVLRLLEIMAPLAAYILDFIEWCAVGVFKGICNALHFTKRHGVWLFADLQMFARDHLQRRTKDTRPITKLLVGQIIAPGSITERLDSFVGNPDTKAIMLALIKYLRDPKSVADAGNGATKGALISGPFGNGKSHLARCIAGAAGVTLITIPSSLLFTRYTGHVSNGPNRVHDLFKVAAEHAPCVLFIDEITVIDSPRNTDCHVSIAEDLREQTLNQIKTELRSLDPQLGVLVLASTVRPEVLTGYLQGPDYLSLHIKLELPNLEERREFLTMSAIGKKFAANANFDHLARNTNGLTIFSLATILTIAHELMLARLEVAKAHSAFAWDEINHSDIEHALQINSRNTILQPRPWSAKADSSEMLGDEMPAFHLCTSSRY